jgi:hypothetical protein
VKPSRRPPVQSVLALQGLKASGTLENLYWWVVHRVREYRIQLDEHGTFGHKGEAYPENKVVSMLKRDFRDENRERMGTTEFPTLSNTILDHVVRHALKRLVEAGFRELARRPPGTYEE